MTERQKLVLHRPQKVWNGADVRFVPLWKLYFVVGLVFSIHLYKNFVGCLNAAIICVVCICIFVDIAYCRPPKSVCRQCAEYTGPHPAHGDGNNATTLGAAAAAVGSAVSKVVGMVTGTSTFSFMANTILFYRSLHLNRNRAVWMHRNFCLYVAHWIFTWMSSNDVANFNEVKTPHIHNTCHHTVLKMSK